MEKKCIVQKEKNNKHGPREQEPKHPTPPIELLNVKIEGSWCRCGFVIGLMSMEIFVKWKKRLWCDFVVGLAKC
jgi:hypothetical protein